VKWYQFAATNAGNPGATVKLVAGVDESQLVETLSGFMSHQVKPSQSEALLFAIAILRKKALQLISARIGAEHEFHLSEFQHVDIDAPLRPPAFAKGGLSLWISH
jgi:hypothetical protein